MNVFLDATDVFVLRQAIAGLAERLPEVDEVGEDPMGMQNKLKVANKVAKASVVASDDEYRATMDVLDAAEDVLGDEDEDIEALSTKLYCAAADLERLSL